MTEPFCDYFAISTARDDADALIANLEPVIDAAGGYLDDTRTYRFENGGTVKTYRRGPVFVVGTSGQALAQLRALNLFDRYLFSIMESPPVRVTSLHATQDFYLDAPPRVRSLFKKARKGRLRLSRKAIKPGNIEKRFGVDDRGEETGTVYLGKRTSEVWAKVYDKRHERECRGFPDPGPLLRIEVAATSKLGISLRDVHSPGPLFYHFAAPDLTAAPDGMPPWTPGGLPLKLPPPAPLLPAQRLKRLVEASPDIQRALELARQIGPHGMAYLVRRLELSQQKLQPGQVN